MRFVKKLVQQQFQFPQLGFEVHMTLKLVALQAHSIYVALLAQYLQYFTIFTEIVVQFSGRIHPKFIFVNCSKF